MLQDMILGLNGYEVVLISLVSFLIAFVDIKDALGISILGDVVKFPGSKIVLSFLVWLVAGLFTLMIVYLLSLITTPEFNLWFSLGITTIITFLGTDRPNIKNMTIQLLSIFPMVMVAYWIVY